MADADCTACIACGNLFQSKGPRGRRKLYCRPGCRPSAYAPKANRFVPVTKGCPSCGEPFTITRKKYEAQVCCSDLCARRHRYGERFGFALRPRFCAGCHAPISRLVRTDKDAGRFCTKQCYGRAKTRIGEERRALLRIGVNVKRRLALASQPPKLSKSEQIAPCCVCGAGVVLEKHKQARGACCSDACRKQRRSARRKESRATEAGKRARRVAKSKRRAKMRGLLADRIDPLKVFERDGWRCHLCGIKTKRALRGRCDPLAPELDHVVSLAAGGAHSWGNVACSCRACNHAKGAQSVGQLGFGFPA